MIRARFGRFSAWRAFGCVAGVAMLAGPVAGADAAEMSARTALERLDRALARGEIGYSEVARQKLFYLFDRTRMDPAWGGKDEPPAKCGTPVLAELGWAVDRLDSDTRALYRGYTRTSAAGGADVQSQHIYETSHFHIEYAISGPDAPTLADVSPANGVPDYVERTGAACESAWAVEVADLGYTAPQLNGGPKGKYVIEYQAQSSYGYTVIVSG